MKQTTKISIKEAEKLLEENKKLTELKKELEIKLTKSVNATSNDYKQLRDEYEKRNQEVISLKEQIRALKSVTEEEKYAKKLKDGAIFFCNRVNDFIEKVGGFCWLSEHINELPAYERKSYIKAVEMVENWAFAIKANMKTYLERR